MNRVYMIALFAAMLALAVVMGACAPAAPAAVVSSVANVTFHAADFAFSGPAQIPSGYTSITLVNDGKEPHQAQLARLNEGVTMEQLQQAIQSPSPEAALGMVTLYGGPAPINAGKSQTITMNLATGKYVMLCFVSGQDNVPHIAKGMIATLDVTSAPGSAAGAPNPVAAEPHSDATATLKDFTIQVPSTMKAGPQVWKVTNNGPQPHEMGLMKLAEGKTAKDFEEFMQNPNPSGPPPFEFYGGLSAIGTGMSGWVNVDLTPGNYVALCFVPDPSSGKAHAELGMVTPFTVSK